jgi:hypothetical protein
MKMRKTIIAVQPFTVEDECGLIGRYKSLTYARNKAQKVANECQRVVRVYDNYDRLREVAEPTLPECALVMGCLCAFHARGGSALESCNTDES